VSLSFAAKQTIRDDPAFAQIDSIVKSLSEITGLSENHSVAYGRMTKRQLRQFLNKRIKKTLKPEEIRSDELSLKMFGLVPQDFDLKKSTIDLLTEQAAAFYDYDEKKLFLLDDPSSAGETTTLAHELSHALADQHFDLDHFMEETPSNDDENLAHTAVVEGQASWLMIAYELKESGKPPVPTPEMLKSVADSSEASMADYPVLKSSPLYIQQSLLFPYAQGTLFFDAVFRKMGKKAFAAVFTDPPVDSAQVMHASRYFEHEKPSKPELPKISFHKEGKELSEGSVGEFDHTMLLQQYLGEPKAAQLAPHLRGGQFRIVTAGKERKPVLEYVSQWDSEKEAGAFFRAYEEILKKKWQHCDISAHGLTVLAGTGDSGYFVTRLSGTTVSSIEGLSDLLDWQHLKPTDASLTAAEHRSHDLRRKCSRINRCLIRGSLRSDGG
jgi:Zn-dependent peptidase ImmA (M78 family)